ncbi:MAG: GNAT family N-acetyltransferase [Oscillospiraceae bacterium]
MTKIYLIRHAEAEGNVYRRIQGWYNSRLTEKGYRQLSALEKRFEGVQINAVYSSDLMRTQLTAGAIANPRGLRITVLPGLREVGMGSWEDKPWGDAERYEKDQLSCFNAAPHKWNVPGCETFEEQRARIVGTVRAIAESHDGQTVAIVSHGAILRVLMLEAEGLPPSEINQIIHCNNTAVSLMEYDKGAMKMAYTGDSSHLTEENSAFTRQNWWKNKSGFDSASMWFRPFDAKADAGLYIACRRDAWLSAHKTMEGFSEDCLETAKKRALIDPRALVLAMSGDEFGGIIELDLNRASDKGAGWISFYYMCEKYRGTSMSLQLLGHAVSVYRGLGRKSLRLMVAEENENAVGYYEHNGFITIGEEQGMFCRLFLMEKDISI